MGKPSWDTEFDLVPIVYPLFNSLPPGKFIILFCRLLIFFQNQLFRKILSGIPPECQPVLIQIRPDLFIGPDLGPNRLQKLSVDKVLNRHVQLPDFFFCL